MSDYSAGPREGTCPDVDAGVPHSAHDFSDGHDTLRCGGLAVTRYGRPVGGMQHEQMMGRVLRAPAPTLADDVTALRAGLPNAPAWQGLHRIIDRIAGAVTKLERATDRNGWPLKQCTTCSHITAETREACRSCGNRESRPLYV